MLEGFSLQNRRYRDPLTSLNKARLCSQFSFRYGWI